MKRKRMRSGGMFPADQDLENVGLFPSFRQRIGTTEKRLLDWAVRAVQREPKDMTPGDWDNLRSEFAVFVMWKGPHTGQITDFGRGKWVGAGNEIARPSTFEARDMLTRMKTMIEAAVKRRAVTVGTVSGTLALHWHRAGGESFWSRHWHGVKFNWPDEVALTLADLIHKEGSLLKECPAPLPRDEDVCGTWFVANRPKQEYCSATCQSRASTRAKRHGTLTPAMQRQKARKEG